MTSVADQTRQKLPSVPIWRKLNPTLFDTTSSRDIIWLMIITVSMFFGMIVLLISKNGCPEGLPDEGVRANMLKIEHEERVIEYEKTCIDRTHNKAACWTAAHPLGKSSQDGGK